MAGRRMLQVNAWFHQCLRKTRWLHPKKILQMIRCKCEMEKPCSRKSCNCSQAQLSCFMLCLYYGNRCYNMWTIRDPLGGQHSRWKVGIFAWFFKMRDHFKLISGTTWAHPLKWAWVGGGDGGLQIKCENSLRVLSTLAVCKCSS